MAIIFEKENAKTNPESTEDFVVSIASSADEDTVIVTGNSFNDKIRTEIERKLLSALESHDSSNKNYSAFLNDKGSDVNGLSIERFKELADNAQSDLKKILDINGYVRFFINADDLIGKTYEAIETNVNTEIRLSYNNSDNSKRLKTTISKAKTAIKSFNKQVNQRNIVRSEIPLAYSEGTRVLYLRSFNDNYVVDSYPLGVAIISDYSINGKPVVLIDIKELQSRLKKTQLKTKSGKSLFFDDIEKEIEANYPPEVLQAYKDKEKYAVLDNRRTGVIRVNNLNRKYGLTPLFRALKYVLLLDDFAKSDKTNSKAKAKKIIFQKLRKEVMGQDYSRKGWEDMAYAHDQFCRAFKQDTVLYTGTPAVENITVVDTKADMIDIKTLNEYRNRIMVTLGVSYLITDSGQTVSISNLSISQLLLCINKIAEQLESIFEGWYELVLEEQNIGAEYAPTIRIIDSEMMETKLRIELAKLLYATFNCSRETTFDMVGLDLVDEMEKRKKENAEKVSDIFTPHPTSFNSSGNDTAVGRPQSEQQTNKTVYDENYNKDVRV